MHRVRTSIVACVLMIGGLGLEAAQARDGGTSAPRDWSTQKASVPDKRSRLRKFIDAIKGHETSYPKNRDWTTGRDDGFSKPWLKR